MTPYSFSIQNNGPDLSAIVRMYLNVRKIQYSCDDFGIFTDFKFVCEEDQFEELSHLITDKRSILLFRRNILTLTSEVCSIGGRDAILALLKSAREKDSAANYAALSSYVSSMVEGKNSYAREWHEAMAVAGRKLRLLSGEEVVA